jgi:hypothetical protein
MDEDGAVMAHTDKDTGEITPFIYFEWYTPSTVVVPAQVVPASQPVAEVAEEVVAKK